MFNCTKKKSQMLTVRHILCLKIKFSVTEVRTKATKGWRSCDMLEENTMSNISQGRRLMTELVTFLQKKTEIK